MTVTMTEVITAVTDFVLQFAPFIGAGVVIAGSGTLFKRMTSAGR